MLSNLSTLLNLVLLMTFTQTLKAQTPDNNAPFLKVQCPKQSASSFTPLEVTIISQLTDFQAIIKDFLDENDSGLDTSVVSISKLEDILPDMLRVDIGSCQVAALRMPILEEENTIIKYNLQLEDFRTNCNTLESTSKSQLTNKQIYSLKNNLNFQFEASTSEIYKKYQVTKKLQDTFVVKYKSEINCDYQLEYDVNLHTDYLSYDKDIRTPMDLEGFKDEGKFSVSMDIYADETYTEKFDVENFEFEGTSYDRPAFAVGETVFVSARLQNDNNLNTKVDDNLNLKAFHCWIHQEQDMCSKPHFSVIEDSCIEDFVKENGFKTYTENGAAGDNFNISFPVFKMQENNNDETKAALTFLTCDFEVCLGTCEEECIGPIEMEEDEVNYVCEAPIQEFQQELEQLEGLENITGRRRRKRSLDKLMKNKNVPKNHIITSLGPFSRQEKLIPISDSMIISLSSEKLPIQIQIIEEYQLEGQLLGNEFNSNYQIPKFKNPNNNKNPFNNTIKILGQNFSYKGFILVVIAASLIIILLLVMIVVYLHTSGLKDRKNKQNSIENAKNINKEALADKLSAKYDDINNLNNLDRNTKLNINQIHQVLVCNKNNMHQNQNKTDLSNINRIPSMSSLGLTRTRSDITSVSSLGSIESQIVDGGQINRVVSTTNSQAPLEGDF